MRDLRSENQRSRKYPRATIEQSIIGQISGFSTFRISVIFALSRNTPAPGDGITGLGFGAGTVEGAGAGVGVGTFDTVGAVGPAGFVVGSGLREVAGAGEATGNWADLTSTLDFSGACALADWV